MGLSIEVQTLVDQAANDPEGLEAADLVLAGGRLFPWRFNLADAFIDVGVGLLIVDSFRKKPAGP